MCESADLGKRVRHKNFTSCWNAVVAVVVSEQRVPLTAEQVTVLVHMFVLCSTLCKNNCWSLLLQSLNKPRTKCDTHTHTHTHTHRLLSQVPAGCRLMIPAHGRWIARRRLTSEAKASLAVLKAQQCHRGALWHAARPPCVSHTESPGEYFLPPLITGLHLLALRNQQPGFIDLP